jgi:hypothetical protein
MEKRTERKCENESESESESEMSGVPGNIAGKTEGGFPGGIARKDCMEDNGWWQMKSWPGAGNAEYRNVNWASNQNGPGLFTLYGVADCFFR